MENNKYFQVVQGVRPAEHAAVLPICAEIEAEISGMEPEEKKLFLADMGLEESGLDRLIQACYSPAGAHLLPHRRQAGGACLDH